MGDECVIKKLQSSFPESDHLHKSRSDAGWLLAGITLRTIIRRVSEWCCNWYWLRKKRDREKEGGCAAVVLYCWLANRPELVFAPPNDDYWSHTTYYGTLWKTRVILRLLSRRSSRAIGICSAERDYNNGNVLRQTDRCGETIVVSSRGAWHREMPKWEIFWALA